MNKRDFIIYVAIFFVTGVVIGMIIESTKQVECPPPVECAECPVCPTLKDQAKKKGRKWLKSTLK